MIVIYNHIHNVFIYNLNIFLCFLAFVMIEGSQAIIQKFIYIFGNFVCLMLAMYKCQTMGLLPTHASDWLAFMDPQKVSLSHD